MVSYVSYLVALLDFFALVIRWLPSVFYNRCSKLDQKFVHDINCMIIMILSSRCYNNNCPECVPGLIQHDDCAVRVS